jgi:hypothetical protein
MAMISIPCELAINVTSIWVSAGSQVLAHVHKDKVCHLVFWSGIGNIWMYMTRSKTGGWGRQELEDGLVAMIKARDLEEEKV